MRWTRTLIPTMKETPAEAEAKSHVLMLRAGMIRRLGSGAYSYLPLGLRSLNKIAGIIREEMDRAGAIEVLMPALWPIELLRESGRLKVFGDDVIYFTDRHDREGVLAPTHEEVVTSLVRDNVRSYREIPITLYQIQTKFRDEARPRFGVLRTKEFLMKDAYSFDADQEGLRKSYEAMYEAYFRIFDRCGLTYMVVDAESGAMGGERSEEFVAPCEVPILECVCCEGCGYAANTERGEIGAPPEAGPAASEPELKVVDTPGQVTIEQVSAFLNVNADQMIKTLIYAADGKPVAALVRGDHELNESKLARVLGAKAVELADEKTIESATGAPVGFAGPVGLEGVEIIADHAVPLIQDGVTGANKADAHMVGVLPGRDFTPDKVADLRVAAGGDPCPRCGKPMATQSGMELGHVFQLGTYYSEAMGATFLDSQGKQRPYVMGCYGIGLNRIAAAAIESYADEGGIVWPPNIAPYEVVVLPLDVSDEKIVQGAEQAYEELIGAGVDAILDDREEKAGFKFKDADLVGFPLRVVVGKGYLKTGKLELQVRRDGAKCDVEPEALAGRVRELLAQLSKPARTAQEGQPDDG